MGVVTSMNTESLSPFERLRAASRAAQEPVEVQDDESVEPEETPEESEGLPRCGTSSVDVGGMRVDVSALAGYDYGAAPWERTSVTVKPVEDARGRWSADISWLPPALPAGQVGLYRVMLGEGKEPDVNCEEVETTLCVTTECSTRDAAWINTPQSAVRYYEVWCYAAATLEKALVARPYLVGSSFIVWPVSELAAVVDHGQVVVSWNAPHDSGLQFRWIRQTPREKLNAPDCRPEEGEPTPSTGFSDREVAPGEEYFYSVFAGVEVGGQVEWATPVRTRVKVSAVLRPVMDLQVFPRDGGTGVDLCWSPVAGAEVRIYRSEVKPQHAAHEVGVIDEDELQPQVNLRAEDRLPYRPVIEGDLVWMRDVALPDTGAELYFTPVTSADHRCAPGKYQEWVRLQPPVDPFVDDRVDWILVVFEWPEGASDVQLYVSEVGRPVDPARLPPLERISEQDHRTFGGFRVDRARFKAGTCDLHLAGCRFGAGEPKFSATSSVTHTFPALVRYGLEAVTSLRKTRWMLTIVADEDVRDAELMLAWNSRFLPLSSTDREKMLMQTTVNLRRREPVRIDLSERVEQMPQAGFLRLLCRPSSPIALIDPPLHQLRLQGI